MKIEAVKKRDRKKEWMQQKIDEKVNYLCVKGIKTLTSGHSPQWEASELVYLHDELNFV